jgi:hypothetical protein
MEIARRIFWLFLLVVLIVLGCATVPRVTRSHPGDVVFINHNQGADAYCVLFRGGLPKSKLFAINPQTGGLMWSKQPLGRFELGSAFSREFPRIGRLNLRPEADYTLYVAWVRFGRALGEDVVTFRTYIDPCRDYRIGRLGGRICASTIVDLPRVNTRGPARFSFHKTLYIGDWIKALVGLP